MTPFGIVVNNLGGGDASYTFVDEERWSQIVALNDTLNEPGGLKRGPLMEVVMWLTSAPGEEVDPPPNPPEPRGKILKQVFTQTFVMEAVDLQGTLIGILTYP